MSRGRQLTHWRGSAVMAFEGGRAGLVAGGLALLATSAAEPSESPEQAILDACFTDETRFHQARLVDRIDRTECDQSQHSVIMGQRYRLFPQGDFENYFDPRLEGGGPDGMEEGLMYPLR